MKFFYNVLMALSYFFLFSFSLAFSSPRWLIVAILGMTVFFFVRIMYLDVKKKKEERLQRRKHIRERKERKMSMATSYRQANIANLYGDEYIPHS